MSLQHRILGYKGRLSHVSARTAAWKVSSERLERLLEIQRALDTLLLRVKTDHPSFRPLDGLREAVNLQVRKLDKDLAAYQKAKEAWNRASEDARDLILNYTDKIHLWRQLSALLWNSPNEVEAVDKAMTDLSHSAIENF